MRSVYSKTGNVHSFFLFLTGVAGDGKEVTEALRYTIEIDQTSHSNLYRHIVPATYVFPLTKENI